MGSFLRKVGKHISRIIKPPITEPSSVPERLTLLQQLRVHGRQRTNADPIFTKEVSVSGISRSTSAD
jgi:hypothetical protein